MAKLTVASRPHAAGWKTCLTSSVNPCHAAQEKSWALLGIRRFGRQGTVEAWLPRVTGRLAAALDRGDAIEQLRQVNAVTSVNPKRHCLHNPDHGLVFGGPSTTCSSETST